MPEAFTVLGQLVPSLRTLTDFVTVPAVTSEIISTIFVCNQNRGDEIRFRISVAVAGAADDPKQYIYYDVPILGNDSYLATVGLTLATTDVIRVYADSSNVSFNAFGDKVT